MKKFIKGVRFTPSNYPDEIENKIQKYRKQAVEKESSALTSCAEHKMISDALATRDPEKAESAMNEHIKCAFGRVKELDIK